MSRKVNVLYTGAGYYGMKGSVRVLFRKLHSRGERGRKGRECKFQNNAHKTFDPRKSFIPVHAATSDEGGWQWQRSEESIIDPLSARLVVVGKE